jgi:fermentation-respiration switch protein FrsA (DUF1100 family)
MGIPEGQWRELLEREFLDAAQAVADDAGEPGEIVFYPDRTWHGRTYVPASAATASGMEVYGYVVFVPADDPLDDPTDFSGHADFTEQTAEQNPDWELDLSDEVIGTWHGVGDDVASMTLVWGRSLVTGGVLATAELGGVSVDECPLDDRRFTLLAPDDYAGELLEVHLYSDDGDRIARESLYE